MNRRRLAVRAVAVAVLVVFVALTKWPRHENQWLVDLTDHALAHGTVGTIPAEALAHLKLPTGNQRDVPFRGLVVTGSPSHTKSFCVRQRGKERDVLISDAYSNRGRFFHCSLDGSLISSSIINETLTPVDTYNFFLKELAFWREWWAQQQRN